MSTTVAVERYSPDARDAWDVVVRSARAQHFIFERDYMDYHQDRFPDASWVVLLDGRPEAVFPASRHGAEVISHGGLTFGGLLSRATLTTARTVHALDKLIVELRADGVRRLTYKPMPHIYHVEPAEEDLFALHAAGAVLKSREVTVAIAPGPRPTYSEERRRAVRRKVETELEFRECNQIEEFMVLLSNVLRERHDATPVHSTSEMQLLASRFPGRIRLFVATEHTEIIAGTIVFQSSSVAHTQYIATGQRGRELRALDKLFDYLLSEVFSRQWFDFGTSVERDGKLNAGLIRNKEGYGARAIVHDCYSIDLS